MNFFCDDLLERYVDMGKKRKATPLFSVPFALEGCDTIIVYYICMRKNIYLMYLLHEDGCTRRT